VSCRYGIAILRAIKPQSMLRGDGQWYRPVPKGAKESLSQVLPGGSTPGAPDRRSRVGFEHRGVHREGAQRKDPGEQPAGHWQHVHRFSAGAAAPIWPAEQHRGAAV
jgi:hypothetical protein